MQGQWEREEFQQADFARFVLSTPLVHTIVLYGDSPLPGTAPQYTFLKAIKGKLEIPSWVFWALHCFQLKLTHMPKRYFCVLSCVWHFAIPWTVACQAPLSMEISRQEYWSGLPFPIPGIFLTQGLKLCLLLWQVDSLPLSYLGSPQRHLGAVNFAPLTCLSPWSSLSSHNFLVASKVFTFGGNL